MFKRVTIMAAFFIIDKFLINRIAFQPLQDFFRRLVYPAKQVADILTDENPANTEQMKAFWEKQQLEILDNTLETAKNIIRTKVKDETLKLALVAILDEIDDQVGGDTPSMIALQNYFNGNANASV